MEEEEVGKCIMCGRENKHKSLYVKHNHKTGEIRGLVCFKCSGIFEWHEKYKDKIEEYLNKEW